MDEVLTICLSYVHILLFVVFKAFEMRNAGAVVHSHGLESCLVTMLNPSAREFRVSPMCIPIYFLCPQLCYKFSS